MKVAWEEDFKSRGLRYTGYVVRRVQNNRPTVVVTMHNDQKNVDVEEVLTSWSKMFGDWETDKLVKILSESQVMAEKSKEVIIVGR